MNDTTAGGGFSFNSLLNGVTQLGTTAAGVIGAVKGDKGKTNSANSDEIQRQLAQAERDRQATLAKTNWPLIGGIGAGVLALIAVLFYAAKK
jgi:hypothetical protein